MVNGSGYKYELPSIFKKRLKEAKKEARENQDRFGQPWCVVRIDGYYLAVHHAYCDTHKVKPVAIADWRDRFVPVINTITKLLKWLTK
jgi:hypothetical protein